MSNLPKPTAQYYDMRHGKWSLSGSPVVYKPNCFIRDQALKALLQESVRGCGVCHSLGAIHVPEWVKYMKGIQDNSMVECPHCSGHGIVCAWCNSGVDSCECGGE